MNYALQSGLKIEKLKLLAYYNEYICPNEVIALIEMNKNLKNLQHILKLI